MVVLGHLTLSFEDLNEHTWLVVGVGSEGLLLLGWDGGVSWDQNGHDLTSSLNTLREWGNIEKEQVLDSLAALSGENGSLNSGTVGDGLIWVDGSVELLAIEEVLEHGLNFWNTGGTSDKENLVDLTLADIGVLEHVLDGWHALAEVREAKLLELGSGDVHVEILTLSESLAVNFSLMGSRKNSLGLLALSSESSHGSCISSDVDSSLLLELSDAVVDKHIVEIFSSQVGVSIGSLDLENSIFDTEERHIKGATTEIKNEDISFALILLVESISDGSGGWLVNDSLHVET